MSRQHLSSQPETPDPDAEALAPLSIIRTETVLSKLPIHNLAKTGKVDIRITKRKDNREVDLRWEVSYNERYGQARQLAYKLDTIVINRLIDEAGRPVPKMICLGSLRDLARHLDMGGNTNSIRTALRQNAFTAISAKVTYKTADGAERTLEADFTRYNVVFTGEKLPDGRRADAVYLVFNEPYWEVLNNAPTRPLDYDYLKALNPAAQRFYEVISYRIFAALKFKHPHARMLYSDYCAFSAQQRCVDYDHFKKQMYKVHRPHLQSGYLAKVHVEERVNDEGQLDWMLCYTPGAKARAEYAAFTRKGKLLDLRAEETETTTKNVTPRLLASASSPARASNRREDRVEGSKSNNHLLDELRGRGITEAKARKLLASVAPDQPVLDQLDWGDALIADSSPGTYHNPPGFYVYLVQNNVFVPASFETRGKRETQAAAENERARSLNEQAELEWAYDEYRRAELDRHIADVMPEAERKKLYEAKRRELLKQHPNIAAWAEEDVNRVVHVAVQSEVNRQVKLESFDEFRARRKDS